MRDPPGFSGVLTDTCGCKILPVMGLTKTRTRFLILFTRRREYIVYHRTIRTGGKAVLHPAGSAPEVASTDMNFLASLAAQS